MLLDLYSRYVPGWMLAIVERADLARRPIDETIVKHNVDPRALKDRQHQRAGRGIKRIQPIGTFGTRYDARGVEQAGKNLLTPRLNAVNSISPIRADYPTRVTAGQQWLKTNLPGLFGGGGGGGGSAPRSR